jgi:serine/threonine protein kinase
MDARELLEAFRARVPDFQVEKKLGAGNMGLVLLGTHQRLGVRMAAKLLFMESAGPEETARFRREAKLYASLTHPNLVKIFDADLEGQPPYVLLEYIPGQDLRSALKERRKPDLLPCAAALASALAYVHGRDILHRDIKSANVMMAHNGLWKLTDFDVACSTSDPGATVAGTPGYLAPELLIGRPATERSDVYALGVVFHLMLTGELPFGSADSFQRMTRCLEEEPTRLRKLRPTLPEELEQVLASALRRDPSERTPSMRAFADQLWRLVLGESAAQRIKRSMRLVWGRAPAPSKSRETAKTPVSRPAMPPPSRPSFALRRHAAALMAALLVLGGGLFAASRTAIGEDPQNEPMRMMREAAARAAAMGMGNGLAGEAVRKTVR